MDEKLNSYREVEEMLGSLGREQYPVGETVDLIGLIRIRMEHPILPAWVAFRPALATAFVLAVVGGLFWGLQLVNDLPFKNRQESRFLAQEIDVRGIVVGKTGSGLETQKLEVIPRDSIATDEQSSLTVYLPGAGYIHLPKETHFSLSEAKQNIETGLMSYALMLDKGSLYAQLPEFQSGSFLTVETPAGFVRVTGTDFLLGIDKDGSTSVFVLTGSVETEARRKPNSVMPVKSGSRALILPDSSGTLLVNELSPDQQIKLKTDFEHIFGKILAHDTAQKQIKERSIKILWRKDE